MERRDFIQKGAMALSLPFWMQSCQFLNQDSHIPISIKSDYEAGHLMMKSRNWPIKKIETGKVIVGGGLAGLTAAHELKEKDFLLFELSDRFGGTSSAESRGNFSFSIGAHYEMAYPAYYGEQVLRLLEGLNIIEFQSWKNQWSFVENQHLIPHFRKQRCFEQGEIRKEVISTGPGKDALFHLLQPFEQRMKLPTRLIDPELRHLNELTLAEYLANQIGLDPTLKRQIDYHMLDDYGGTSAQVSALAGIHYYKCRAYQSGKVDLFSPSSGNYYFAKRLVSQTALAKIKLHHLVTNIRKNGSGFVSEVLDISNQRKLNVSSEQVIYAGQKHALKYVVPEEADLFDNAYAPWMVVSLISDQKPGNFGFWQNEKIGDQSGFIGFIDSSVQDQLALKGKRIITAYYCLSEKDRPYLAEVANNKQKIISETIGKVSEMMTDRLKFEAAFIHVMGHAMAIPKPGHLFQSGTEKSRLGIIYAGVDDGRLPLLFEAVDSGICAVERCT